MSISAIVKPETEAIELSHYQLVPSITAQQFHLTVSLVSSATLWKQINNHIAKCEFNFAHRLQAKYPLLIPLSRYKQQLQVIVEELLRYNLSIYDFQQADEICRASHYPISFYEAMKSDYIQQFSRDRFGLELVPEQSAAIAKTANHLLIKARAGSGKTAVMACKAATLLNHYKHNPNSILILAFNRKAASEIKQRLRKAVDIEPNARTFHSLASNIIHPAKVLWDDPEGNPDQTNFIKALLTQNGDDELNRQIYQFLRNEYGASQADNTALASGDATQVTMNGIRVKSTGEKYIGDFLVEHDITFYYERAMSGLNGTIYPDFTLWIPALKQEFVWEHWAIGKINPRPVVPLGWDITEVEYAKRKEEKRRWYAAKGIRLIETSVDDLVNGRDAFEQILYECLAKAGIQAAKLSSQAVQEKLADKINPKLIRLCQQFISRAKQAVLSPDDLRLSITKHPETDQRTRIFWTVATRLYELYQAELLVQGYRDFDDLLVDAIQWIRSTGGTCRLSLTDRSSIVVCDIRYILIDEYQDFSQLFYQLIESIRLQNPQVQILAVGDDWQAINGFAGSHLQYFHQFTDLFPGGQATTLLTNHRSFSKIVEESNKVMADKGQASTFRTDHIGGTVGLQYLDNVWLPPKDGLVLGAASDGEANYYFEGFDAAFLAAKCVRVCYKIITAPQNRQKRVAILSRTRYVYGQSLEEFKNKFTEILDAKQQTDIEFSTIHAYKGLEADIVILMDVSRRNFPYLHPDNQLLTLVGVTAEETLAEEQRLFYVAMTRAKEQIYVLAEQNTVSSFAKDLPAAQLEDLSSAPKPSLWVGKHKVLPQKTFVYDPEHISASEGSVHLYCVEQHTYRQYIIAQIKPHLQTITNSVEGQRAIKLYNQWSTQQSSKQVGNSNNRTSSTNHSFDIACTCPVCSGTPELDPIFIHYFG